MTIKFKLLSGISDVQIKNLFQTTFGDIYHYIPPSVCTLSKIEKKLSVFLICWVSEFLDIKYTLVSPHVPLHSL